MTNLFDDKYLRDGKIKRPAIKNSDGIDVVVFKKTFLTFVQRSHLFSHL